MRLLVRVLAWMAGWRSGQGVGDRGWRDGVDGGEMAGIGREVVGMGDVVEGQSPDTLKPSSRGRAQNF